MPISKLWPLGLQKHLLKRLIMHNNWVWYCLISIYFWAWMCISFMVFSPTTSYQLICPSTLLFLLTIRNKPVSWWYRCLARHGFRVPGCFMSYTKVINLQHYFAGGIWWCILCFSASSSLSPVQSLFSPMSNRTYSQNVQIHRCI